MGGWKEGGTSKESSHIFAFSNGQERWRTQSGRCTLTIGVRRRDGAIINFLPSLDYFDKHYIRCASVVSC